MSSASGAKHKEGDDAYEGKECLLRCALAPVTPACSSALRAKDGRPHGRTGTEQLVQPWRSWTDIVATLALNRFRRAVPLPSLDRFWVRS